MGVELVILGHVILFVLCLIFSLIGDMRIDLKTGRIGFDLLERQKMWLASVAFFEGIYWLLYLIFA